MIDPKVMRRYVRLTLCAAIVVASAISQQSRPTSRSTIGEPPDARLRLPTRQQVLPGPEGARAFRDLGRWCHSEGVSEIDAGNEAVRSLRSDDHEIRLSGGRLFIALFAQLKADYLGGYVAGRRATYGYGEDRDRATALWRTLSELAIAAAGSDESVAMATWLLADNSDAGPRTGIDMLVKSHGPAVDAALREASHHSSTRVRSTAFRELARRGLLLENDVHRGSKDRSPLVRVAARSAMATVASSAESRPADTLLPWEREQLALCDKTLLDPIPAHSERVEIRTTRGVTGWGGRDEVATRPTRLVDAWRIMTDWNTFAYIDRIGFPLLIDENHAAPLPGDEVTTVTLASIVDRLLDRNHPFRHVHGKRDDYVYESSTLIDAARLARQGNESLAARMARDVFDRAIDDRAILARVRMEIASLLYEQLVNAVVYGPNIARARQIAAHLASDHFVGTRYHDFAVALDRDFRRRPDDLHSFVLPTIQEWTALRPRLSRAAQIDYCADRLRLLNCIAVGNPGDFSFEYDRTWTDPSACDPLTSRPADHPINPFLALRELSLRIEDVAALAPRMINPPFTFSATYYKPWGPWTLLRVDAAIGELLNEAAGHEIFPPTVWSRLDDQARYTHVQDVIAWCKEHSGLGPDAFRNQRSAPPQDPLGPWRHTFVMRTGESDGLPSPWTFEIDSN